jgi:hypothetical protein
VPSSNSQSDNLNHELAQVLVDLKEVPYKPKPNLMEKDRKLLLCKPLPKIT